MKNNNNHNTAWFNKKRSLLILLCISILMLGAAIFSFTYQNKWLESEYDNQKKITHQENLFNHLFLKIQMAESAIRGYSSTGKSTFANNFTPLLQSIQKTYSDLISAEEKNNSVTNLYQFATLDRLIKEKLIFMQEVKQLCDSENFTEASLQISKGKGIELTDSILGLHESANLSIRNNMIESENKFSQLNKRNNAIAYSIILFSLTLIAFVFYYLFKEIKTTKALSREVKQRKETYKITLNSLSEGVITTDRDGRIRFMNASAEKLTGWSHKEAHARKLQEVFTITPEDPSISFNQLISRVLTNGNHFVFENNGILQNRKNIKITVSNSASPMYDEAGRISGAVLLFNNITERQQIRAALKENEKRYADLIQNLPLAVYTCDEQGYVQLYNKAAVELWGREPVIGKDLWCGSWKIFSPNGDNMPLNECPMSMALKNQKPVQGKEIMVQRPDGTFRHVLPNPVPLFNNTGKLTGAVNMLIDITDKKEREILIKSSEEKFRSIFERASDAIMIFSFDGSIHEFNDRACSISGYTKEEFEKLQVSDILVGDLIENKDNYDALMTGTAVTLYRQFRKKDGTLLDMEIVSKQQPDGKFLSIGRDVTERKKQEAQLKMALEQYDILSKATSDTIWDFDLINDSISYSSGVKIMFGYDLSEVSGTANWWKNNLHPDDFNRIQKAMKSFFQEGRQAIQMEYRFRCKDNSYKYIFDRAYILYDETGKARRIIGAMQDISPMKEQELMIAKTIISTQESERQQIGMELHDNVNQLLSATLLYLSLSENDDSKIKNETIKLSRELITQAIAENRRLSHRLAPYAKEDVTLKEVIESLVEPMSKTNQFNIKLNIQEFKKNPENQEMQTHIYRILQEQLNNIIKYAHASEVTITISVVNEIINMNVTDNGSGFDPENVKKGIGLANIKRRIDMLHGKLNLISSPGDGCSLDIVLPLYN